MLSSNILDKLTNVNLENKFNEPSVTSFIDCDNSSFPLYTVNSVIVGSGAAGLRAAVELKRRNVDVIVVTSMLYAGTSACSGSDKQTLFTASTGKNGDNVYAVAKAIAAGDEVEVDFDSGVITDKTTGQSFQGQAFPEFMQKIITAGGLVNYINQK